MNEVIYKKINDKKVVEYHVLGVEDWDFFDTLIEYFIQEYNSIVTIKDDGINSRIWQLRCKDEYFILEHYEDVGNWFYSCNSSGDSGLMDDIAKKLERALKDVPYD